MKVYIEIIITLIITVLVCYTIFFYVRSILFINKAKKEKNNSQNIKDNKKKIIIAIPCLREQNCIEDTVRYFCEIAKDIPIIIITTQKEIKENINNKTTTQEIVRQKILPKYKNVYLLDYPYTDGYMAHQLNYMLDNLDKVFKEKVELENTYLALYNADSRPNPQTFNEINNKIKQGDKVIQQYSYCMKNYNELSNILKGFAIYQSNFEIKTGLINTFFQSKILYSHVLGHGLIINMKTLRELGNFNKDFWCEDIYLGIQLKFHNIITTPLLTLENIETPNTLPNLVKQNSVWFKTTSQFRKIYKDIIKRGKVKNKIKGLIACFNEYRCAINWMGFPIILFATIISGMLIKNYMLLLIFILSYLLYISLNTIMTIAIINILDEKNYKVNLRMIFNMAIATAISNFGPIYSVITNKKEKHKTER